MKPEIKAILVAATEKYEFGSVSQKRQFRNELVNNYTINKWIENSFNKNLDFSK